DTHDGAGSNGGDGDPGCDCDREGVEDNDPRTPAQQHANALMDLARAAGDADLTDGASSRAKITVLIPGERLWTCPSCRGHHHGPDESCHGPGHGLWAGAGSDALTAEAAAAAAQAMADALAAGRPEQHACSWAVGNGPGRGFLALSDALRLACDAEITRLVIGPDSQPLNVGRTTRTIPAHLRTALNVRDRGCVICPPGERPPGWCHAHHIQHWAAGGETGIHNLALLCHRHHRDLHHGIWTITIGPDHLPHVTPGPEHPNPGNAQAHLRRRHRHPSAT
ncbi:MAG: hypothetical protein QG597_112, partial [Actinomycetota bacterium]|nr:hypothetical protein [Actinomycetota bacterium]